MAGVRDPAFWKRFSVAVHLDEEKGGVRSTPDSYSNTSNSSRPPLKHTESWLEKNRKKQRRTRICGWIILLIFLLIAAGITFIVLWFLKTGPFKTGEPVKDAHPTSTPSPTSTPQYT